MLSNDKKYSNSTCTKLYLLLLSIKIQMILRYDIVIVVAIAAAVHDAGEITATVQLPLQSSPLEM